MRDIKFRVWDGHNMHYPPVVEIGICGVNGLTSASFQSENGGYMTSVYAMQSTGLRDKNGVEIYEGDVVKYQGWEVSMGKQKRPDRLIVVGNGYKTKNQFGDPLPQGNWIDDCYHLQNVIDGGSPVEVIGNIHENPELKEVE